MSRKKVVAIAVAAVVLASVVALAALAGPVDSQATGGDAVAVVRLSGPIQETGTASLLGGGAAITPQIVADRLGAAADNPRVKAVVLRVDSPGGTVAASQEIADTVGDFPKPVVVSMGDLAASGGYYISSQADAIVAQPGTLTGSIGVIWSSLDPKGLFRKLGIKLDTVTAGKHKDMFLPGRLTRPRRRILQEMVNDMYSQFVTAVSRGRDLPRVKVRKLATGQLYTGEQAVEAGLVDDLGGLDDAIARAERLADIHGAEVLEMSPTFWEQLFGAASSAGVASPWSSTDTALQRLALLREVLTGYTAPRYSVP